MPNVPAYVTDAIQKYKPLPGFTVLSKRRRERSLIFDWGVLRSCQRENKIIQLYGNTSKATKHLTEVYRETSSKSQAESSHKRTRQYEWNRIRNVIACMITGECPYCWKPCYASLTSLIAATKTAFGIVAQRSASKNMVITDLNHEPVYAIRSNDAIGSLFAELCTQLQLGGETQLQPLNNIILWVLPGLSDVYFDHGAPWSFGLKNGEEKLFVPEMIRLKTFLWRAIEPP
ncbi:LOW QUALITY PROTEIN: hypothetical protein PHMEG_0009806 [Phytophthora megakarya]|uniref:Uncharacterized protein n=1 Tax=Phytophthora megakarya TaxID=4795 RepID=A0A225WFB4_9STRA|nr:LOW QUALITY PROTEIN: hypothetical protein PHMEG_0009806 [Phytophthora megakarya]